MHTRTHNPLCSSHLGYIYCINGRNRSTGEGGASVSFVDCNRSVGPLPLAGWCGFFPARGAANTVKPPSRDVTVARDVAGRFSCL